MVMVIVGEETRYDRERMDLVMIPRFSMDLMIDGSIDVSVSLLFLSLIGLTQA
jgi:hypothetical protein